MPASLSTAHTRESGKQCESSIPWADYCNCMLPVLLLGASASNDRGSQNRSRTRSSKNKSSYSGGSSNSICSSSTAAAAVLPLLLLLLLLLPLRRRVAA